MNTKTEEKGKGKGRFSKSAKSAESKDKKKTTDSNKKNSTKSSAKPTIKRSNAVAGFKYKPKTTSENDGPKKEVSDRDKRKYIDFKDRQKKVKGDPLPDLNREDIRLNKYLSNAGICSRREADVLIQTGVVTVNDVIVLEMGYKVMPGDKVRYDGETINAEKKRYVLLNKPKDFITTMDDPWGRKTVMSLVSKACRERVYPVGRLDRETTGLLLFTNDGDMAKKLTHPRHKSSKIYHVELNKPVKLEDLTKLTEGIELEDGKTAFDKAEYVKDSSREIGVELHSGKNRIVRRMFESMGYEVVKLDRVQFAGLTKKDLPRGHYRHLTEKELAFLKMS
jgi:23S rRNA pseudouridine2605 synthase